jgi:flavin-dependent dehydrogenase
MHIAIIGCGLSGSLLGYFLPRMDYEVEVYECNKDPKVVCGCGISLNILRDIAIKSKLNPANYILWQSKNLFVKFSNQEFKMDVTNSCIFNKEKFILDLVSNSKARFHFGMKLMPQDYSKYDLVIDASGIRACLGKLPRDNLHICYQVKATFEPTLPYPDCLIDFSLPVKKYLWMFPLSPRKALVGCWALEGRIARKMVLEFLNNHKGTILVEQGKLLRLNSPQESLPFIKDNIIGVGTSIGAITSLGEGNVPSIITVKLLLDYIKDPQKYKKKIFEILGWIKYDYAAYKDWINNRKIRLIYNLLKCRKYYESRLSFQLKQTLQTLIVLLKNKPNPLT